MSSCSSARRNGNFGTAADGGQPQTLRRGGGGSCRAESTLTPTLSRSTGRGGGAARQEPPPPHTSLPGWSGRARLWRMLAGLELVAQGLAALEQEVGIDGLYRCRS